MNIRRRKKSEKEAKKKRKSPEVIITPRDISLLQETWRHGLITHKFCSEFYFTSRSRTRARISQLIKNKYLFPKRIYTKKLENIYYLTDKSLKLLDRKKPAGINVIHLYHDRYLLELYSLLRRAKTTEFIRTEREVRADNKKYYKIPDLCFQLKKYKYAIEYERSAKSRKRYNEICIQYLKFYNPDKWIFIYLCEDSVIEDKVKDILKMKQLYVFNADDFLKKLSSAKDLYSGDFQENISIFLSEGVYK